MANVTAFPLQWPDGWDRTPADDRTNGRSKFQRSNGSPRTMAGAVAGLLAELRLLGAYDVTISSNVVLRTDGLPRSGQKAPDDPGAAVYFECDGPKVIARDQYTRAEDNVRSLALAIEGLRKLERHGGGKMLQRAFVGFAALPPPDRKMWWEVLGVPRDATPAQISEARKALARTHSGDNARMTEINVAHDQGMKDNG